MYLLHRQSQQKIIAEIVQISENEVAEIMSKSQFDFDWEQETQYDIYALKITETDEIVGLIALEDVKEEMRVEIKLIESSKENIGTLKVYERIAGCLIAWACHIAFSKRYYGFVSLIPKTRLIEYYQKAYGFEQFGRQLAVESQQSFHLIKKYLNNEQ